MTRLFLTRICILAILLTHALVTSAQDVTPGPVETLYRNPEIAKSFVAGKRWLPVPDYEDRAGWDKLFGPRREQIIKEGETALDYKWQVIPATLYLAYERTGERMTMQEIEIANRETLSKLLLAELAEGEGRFMDQIVNGVWYAAQQISWCLSAHVPRQKSRRSLPDMREHLIDLGSGRMGAMMSLTHYLFHKEFDKIDPSISYAVEQSIDRNILTPYLENLPAHWWLGFREGAVVNNWNPWCNSDTIISFLLMEKDQERLNKALDLAARSTDRFLGYVQSDGACEEGPSYWGHAAGKLYDLLQILYDASGGALSLFESERIRLMGEYMSRANIGSGYVVNFADATGRMGIPSALVWNYGNAVQSREMKDFALYGLANRATRRFGHTNPGNSDFYRSIQNLQFASDVCAEVDSLNRLCTTMPFEEVVAGLRKNVPTATWYPETEVCYMRNSAGWFFGAKGGYNNESHNHNDVGTSILFIRDIPVLVDAGVGTYTKFTFRHDSRYKMWPMQSEWHNLPMINGTAQPFGRDFRSKNATCNLSKGIFALDLAGAYPEDAACDSWHRSYRLATKGTSSLTITDSFTLSERRKADVEHFLVQGKVLLPGEEFEGRTLSQGEIVIRCNKGLNVLMTFPRTMTASVEEKVIEDKRISNVWGPSLRRISLASSDKAPKKGSYTIILTELNTKKPDL